MKEHGLTLREVANTRPPAAWRASERLPGLDHSRPSTQAARPRTGALQAVPPLVPAASQGGGCSEFTDEETSAQKKLMKRNLSYLYKNGKEKERLGAFRKICITERKTARLLPVFPQCR